MDEATAIAMSVGAYKVRLLFDQMKSRCPTPAPAEATAEGAPAPAPGAT